MSAGAFSPRVVEVIWSRDQGRCFRCGRTLDRYFRGSYGIHHRRPRGNGGTSLDWVGMPSNALLLCDGPNGPNDEQRCHPWIESHRKDARNEGFLVKLTGIALPRDVPAWRWNHTEFVWLTDDGIAQPVAKVPEAVS